MKNKTKKIILTSPQIREFAIKLAEFAGRPYYPTILVKDAVEANRHDESHSLLDQILEYAYNLNKASAKAEAKRINEEERIAQLGKENEQIRADLDYIISCGLWREIFPYSTVCPNTNEGGADKGSGKPSATAPRATGTKNQ